MQGIGFKNFALYLERRIEQMFAVCMEPVLMKLSNLRSEAQVQAKELETESSDTASDVILVTTRDCGVSFSRALEHVMDGEIDVKPAKTLEDELREFHNHHEALGSSHLRMLPSDDFTSLNDYIKYLRNDIQMDTFDLELNGGAQYRRLISEVEIFLRLSEISVEIKKRDVMQARGACVSGRQWMDVIVKILSKEAHLPLQRGIQYVTERIKWFFERQKEPTLYFMCKQKDAPHKAVELIIKHATLLNRNEMIKQLVFLTYDKALERHLRVIREQFEISLDTSFCNPWVSLKATSASLDEEAEVLAKSSAQILSEVLNAATDHASFRELPEDAQADPHFLSDGHRGRNPERAAAQGQSESESKADQRCLYSFFCRYEGARRKGARETPKY